MKCKLLIPTLAVIALLMCPVLASTLSDNGYHFKDYESVPNVADYGEWWFFDFYASDIQGIIQYSLWDPAHVTADSYGLMFVCFFKDSVKYEFMFPIPWDYIVTSDETADLVMGPETITVKNGAYTIEGVGENLQGDTCAWSLQYIQASESLNGFRKLKVWQNEELNWFVQMPTATVYGAVVINSEVIPINGARGYHDHNWGVWKLTHSLWNWFQTNTEDFSIVGFDFYLKHKGSITVQVAGKTIVFQKGQYLIVNYDWVLDTQVYTLFPKKTCVLAYNGDYLLKLTISTSQTTIVGRPYGNIAWIVFESTAHYNGFLRGCGVSKQIDSYGFREYSTDVLLPPA